jgi:hypothetical protein
MQPPVCASHCNGKFFSPIPEHGIPQRRPRQEAFPALFTISLRDCGNGPELRFTKNRQKVTILEWNGAALASIAMTRMRVSRSHGKAAKRFRTRSEALRRMREGAGQKKEVLGGATATAQSGRFG